MYTEKNPLVYEDAWDLWPYSYINDDGQPEGYNIDLIGLLMNKLNIPYVIRLKHQQQVFEDLKDKKADLTFGLAAGFHDEYGLYGRNAITLFTQSVVTPKGKNIEVKTFRDLGKPGLRVFVNDSSLCHRLMLDYGWCTCRREQQHAEDDSGGERQEAGPDCVEHALAEMADTALSFK